MKNFLFIALFLPFASIAQDCKLNKTTDPYTKETKLSTGFIPLTTGTNRVSLSVDMTPKEINFLFFFPNAGETKCFDDASTAFAIYEGERMRTMYRNSGAMNCEGYFQLSFRNVPTTPSNLNNLSIKKISTFRFIGNKKDTTTVTLNDEQKLQLMNIASCVIKESKTLLPKIN